MKDELANLNEMYKKHKEHRPQTHADYLAARKQADERAKDFRPKVSDDEMGFGTKLMEMEMTFSPFLGSRSDKHKDSIGRVQDSGTTNP